MQMTQDDLEVNQLIDLAIMNNRSYKKLSKVQLLLVKLLKVIHS